MPKPQIAAKARQRRSADRSSVENLDFGGGGDLHPRSIVRFNQASHANASPIERSGSDAILFEYTHIPLRNHNGEIDVSSRTEIQVDGAGRFADRLNHAGDDRHALFARQRRPDRLSGAGDLDGRIADPNAKILVPCEFFGVKIGLRARRRDRIGPKTREPFRQQRGADRNERSVRRGIRGGDRLRGRAAPSIGPRGERG